tara:strand:- start:589 stop:903 length:315 start_codon:yes stop_codon:yes gene_type:complete
MVNIKNIAIGITSIIIGGGLIFLASKDIKPDNLKDNSIQDAELIIINYFKKLIKKNPTITLDEVILDFEDASINNLSDFAEKKGRTKEQYYKSYKKFFEKAIMI